MDRPLRETTNHVVDVLQSSKPAEVRKPRARWRVRERRIGAIECLVGHGFVAVVVVVSTVMMDDDLTRLIVEGVAETESRSSRTDEARTKNQVDPVMERHRDTSVNENGAVSMGGWLDALVSARNSRVEQAS